MPLTRALLGTAAVLASASAALAERGSDGQLNIIFWQAPSTVNVYLSSGTKDAFAAALVIEPLASFNPDGQLVTRLAAEIPSLENGGISEDLTSVTWKLKEGVKWSDGTPFTAEDVKFTAEYCMNPSGGCAQLNKFDGVKAVEVVDPLTVRVVYNAPRPNPFDTFVGSMTPIIQKAQFEDCLGEKAPTCTAQNFAPIGTGPFRVTDFRTNDVATYEANPEYRDPDKPAFARVTLKGGGDATAAARAVLETGEFDYAWNIQLSPDVMKEMESKGKGRIAVAFGSSIEQILLNSTDASSSLPEGERSTLKHLSPFFEDVRVRQALSMAIDRAMLTEIGYGDTGRPTCDIIPGPEDWAPNNQDCMTQDIEGAKKLLDEAGWTVGADGIREKDGRKLKLLFQTSVNAVRQDFQALIKQWWSEIGVDTELKTVDASVYFGGDAGSPDTIQKFYAEVQMYTNIYDGTDPGVMLAEKACAVVPSPENQWQGNNNSRYCDPAYDEKLAELGRTADPAARRALAKEMNDMVTTQAMSLLPLVARGTVAAVSNSLDNFAINGWDTTLWNVADWSRKK